MTRVDFCEKIKSPFFYKWPTNPSFSNTPLIWILIGEMLSHETLEVCSDFNSYPFILYRQIFTYTKYSNWCFHMASWALHKKCAETDEFIKKPPSWVNSHKYLTVCWGREERIKNSEVSGEGEIEAASVSNDLHWLRVRLNE